MMKVLLLIHTFALLEGSTEPSGNKKNSNNKFTGKENCYVLTDAPGVTISLNDTPQASNKEIIGLSSSVPNPAVNFTVVSYRMGMSGIASLSLYNMLGVSVLTLVHKEQEPGYYTVPVDVSHLPEGTYFYVLQAGNMVKTKRLMIYR